MWQASASVVLVQATGVCCLTWVLQHLPVATIFLIWVLLYRDAESQQLDAAGGMISKTFKGMLILLAALLQ